MDERLWELAGEAETIGEDIVALEGHRVELDKGRQTARQGWRELKKRGVGHSFMLTDVGMFVKKPNVDVMAHLEAEQARLGKLMDDNRAETKQKLTRLGELEGNDELKKWGATFNLKPLSRHEASFDPNAE